MKKTAEVTLKVSFDLIDKYNQTQDQKMCGFRTQIKFQTHVI